MSYSFDIISKQALRAAKQACARIREIYSEGFESWTKDDGSFLTEADQASSKIIVDELKILGIPIICEEESIPSYDERSQWEYFWSVDPLDGTKEFVNRTGEFSVNIALIKGQDPIFGLIASPMTEEVLFGGMDSGVFFGTWSKMDDFQKIESPVTMESLVVIGSKDYALKKMNDIFPEGWPKGTKFIQKGSALKFLELALGKAHFYPRLAPTMEWDTAAGDAILREMKGGITDLNGTPLVYNKESMLNPHFNAKTSIFVKQLIDS